MPLRAESGDPQTETEANSETATPEGRIAGVEEMAALASYPLLSQKVRGDSQERLGRFVFPPFFEIGSAEDEVRAKQEAERFKKSRGGSHRGVAAVFVYLGGYHSHQDEQGG